MQIDQINRSGNCCTARLAWHG